MEEVVDRGSECVELYGSTATSTMVHIARRGGMLGHDSRERHGEALGNGTARTGGAGEDREDGVSKKTAKKLWVEWGGAAELLCRS
jgi:hypothetical protein